MSTKALNGNSHASVAAHVGAQFRHNGGSDSSELQSDQAFADVTGSGHAPALRQKHLTTVLRQVDALLKLNLALKEEAALLAEALIKANRFAFHDELTGLPNRRLLQDHFNQAVARATRQHRQVVLLFLDLNRFKGINDTFGHLIADRLLQKVAGRLTSCIRSSDTACRYGGDEFVVLLPDIETRSQAVAATNKIIAKLANSYVIDRTPISVTASVGMATYPIDGKDYEELIQVADSTMYHNKSSSASTARPVAESVPRV